MSDFLQTLASVGIIPVVKIQDASQAADLARALVRGGLPAAEITFRTPAAADAIAAIACAVPDITVCAGTVLSVDQARRAIQAGAQAVISPGTNGDVVRYCQSQGVPVIPGCATPTEIEAAMALDLPLVKLFPAEVAGGVALLRALYGPYADMKFMPTGGITPDNVGGYLALPNVVACGGSWMVPEGLLQEGRFQEIEALTRQAAACRK